MWAFIKKDTGELNNAFDMDPYLNFTMAEDWLQLIEIPGVTMQEFIDAITPLGTTEDYGKIYIEGYGTPPVEVTRPVRADMQSPDFVTDMGGKRFRGMPVKVQMSVADALEEILDEERTPDSAPLTGGILRKVAKRAKGLTRKPENLVQMRERNSGRITAANTELDPDDSRVARVKPGAPEIGNILGIRSSADERGETPFDRAVRRAGAKDQPSRNDSAGTRERTA